MAEQIGKPLVSVPAACTSKNAYDLKVSDVLVTEGEQVEADQLLAVLEFYKVVTEIRAPVRGIVVGVRAARGDEVQPGDVLIDIRPT